MIRSAIAKLRLAVGGAGGEAGGQQRLDRPPASQIALASQVKWRRYQLARLAGATSSMKMRSAGSPGADRAPASTPISRQSRRR